MEEYCPIVKDLNSFVLRKEPDPLHAQIVYVKYLKKVREFPILTRRLMGIRMRRTKKLLKKMMKASMRMMVMRKHLNKKPPSQKRNPKMRLVENQRKTIGELGRRAKPKSLKFSPRVPRKSVKRTKKMLVSTSFRILLPNILFSGPRETKLRNTPTVTPIDKKRGRPIKISPRAATISSVSTKPTHTSEFFKSSPITSHVSKTAETCCQTDTDLLLKSTYLKECFNTTVRDALGEPVAARLNDMPMVLKKKFLLMIRTISEQEKRILKYEENEEKSLLAVKTLKDFGRSTRLEFSDSFRNIRADLVERKEEFKAHEAEVVAVIKSQTRTYEAYKQQMQKNAEDQKLEYSALLAKVEFLQQELTYEKDRAEFYLRARDVCKKEQNKAIEQAETAVKNLNDRLFLADNETCTRCKTVEKIRKKMTMEVAEMTEKCARANQERNDAVERAALFESAAQKLGKDCDSIKYERDSWKAYAERYKKDVIKLTHTLKGYYFSNYLNFKIFNFQKRIKSCWTKSLKSLQRLKV